MPLKKNAVKKLEPVGAGMADIHRLWARHTHYGGYPHGGTTLFLQLLLFCRSRLLALVGSHQLRERFHGVGDLAGYIAVHQGKLLLRLAGAFFLELVLMLRLAGCGNPGPFLPMLMFEEPNSDSPSYEDTPQSPNCRRPPGHPPRRNFCQPWTLIHSIAPGMHTQAEVAERPLHFRVPPRIWLRVSHHVA
jgi:hypothetical protein